MPDASVLAALIFGTVVIAVLSAIVAALLRRQKAQQAQLSVLQQSGAKLALALDASDAALWEWHIAERRMVLSDRYFEQLGYRPGDHVASIALWRELLHPEDAERAMAAAMSNLRQTTGDIYVNEYRMRDAQGRWRWMLARGRITQRSADGRPVLMVGTHIDIDAMKTEQAATLDLQQRLQKIYATTPDAIGITRLSDARFIDVNEGFLAMTGYAREEVIGRTSTELQLWWPPAQRERLVVAFRDYGFVDSMELVARRKDGSLLTGLMSLRPLNERDDTSMLSIFRDITERQQLQQQADEARGERLAAEAASHAKTEFLSRMSHELRTPLNAVLGFAQLLQVAPTLAARERGQADAIVQAGWHLLNLINDVLDIARIESGHLSLDVMPLSLRPLLEEALELVRGQAAAAGVTLLPAPPECFDHWLAGDPQRLRQALVNLLGNAIKYNRRGGSVSLACRLDEEAGEEGTVLLEISDTGLGMSAEQMAHLFEPFNRLGRERDGIDGTGIGLVLTRHLLDLMGAGLQLASEPGHGTTASLRLRRADRSAGPIIVPLSPVLPTAEAASPSRAPDLLYIEDNAINQALVSEALAAWPGLQLRLADGGAQGLQQAAERRPDLILLDMRLPDMDGLQVLQALKADARLAGIRVVALSASAMPDEIERARDAGALDYWTKPLRIDRFLDDLRQLLTPP